MRTALTILALLATLPAAAETRFPATLAGHAILQAGATVPPPADAPPGFALAGRWANPDRQRADRAGLAPGIAGAGETARPTGLNLPLQGQPAGGLAGLAPIPAPNGDTAFWAIGDAGFRGRAASPDVLLRLHRLRPDFTTGAVTLDQTLFLADPARAVPFHIVTDPSPTRYLTGADLDPSGIVPMQDGGFWVTDRAGPALLEFDAAGKLRDGFEPRRLGVTLRGIDRPAFAPPAEPGTDAVQPNGGLAGLAQTPGGTTIWTVFARPLRDTSPEGHEVATIRLLEFDTAARDWTGREAALDLTTPELSIGGLVLLDDRRALLIEQDAGEGDAGLACGGRRRPPACFGTPARHKRLVLIDLAALDAEGFAKRLGEVDLLDIADPQSRARQPGDRAPQTPARRFALPFANLGAIALAGDGHVLLANDNDPGLAAGRHLARADDTEFVLLHVPELLAAR